jgi:hypothetical protein
MIPVVARITRRQIKRQSPEGDRKMLLAFIVVWVICGIVAAMIGQSKGLNVGTSFLWGVILGVFGVAIVALQKPGAPAGMQALKCPRCNAMQNVSVDQSDYECWQCKATNTCSYDEPGTYDPSKPYNPPW